jgi:tetratricopeptide (TPR) repeat protein
MQQNKPESAAKELRRYLASEPEDGRAHAFLSLCLCDTNNVKEAIREGMEAIRNSPNDPVGYYALGHALYLHGAHTEAIDRVKEAIRLNPWNEHYFHLLGNIYMEQGLWKKALDAAEHGLKVNAEDVDCANLRSRALLQLGRKKEAAATVEGALAIAPTDAMTHATKGWNLLHQARHREALDSFREALRLNPEMKWAKQGLVAALKANYPVYGLLLRYFLWMSRLSPGVRTALFLGMWVIIQVLRGAARTQLAPFVTPLIVLYALFVYLSWTADPFFNLLLRFNPYGRFALNDDEVNASNFVGGLIVLAIVSVMIGLTLSHVAAIIAAALFAALILPASGAFRCAEGNPRLIVGGLAVVLAIAGIFGLGRMEIVPDDSISLIIVVFAIVGCWLSLWVVNIFTRYYPRE